MNYPLTDSGNAKRLADKFADDIRYVPEDDSFYVWDGKKWSQDKRNQIQELAKTISDDWTADADQEAARQVTQADQDARDAKVKAFRKWANRCGMMATISAMIKGVSSITSIILSKDKLNKHHDLLNCGNGVIDLKTGALLPHDRNLYLSQIVPQEYDPNAKSADWDNVISTVTTNHPDMASAFRTLMGYCAQGNKGKEKIVLIYGPGGSGKGTTLGLIRETLGSDFVRIVASNSLLKQDRNGGGASGDIARMEGARIVLASEFDSSQKLEDNFLKLASGNDTIVARQLYAEEREFKPTFQIIFQSNHRPKFDGSDSGNIRRYMEFPFDYVVPVQDPTIKHRLESSDAVKKAVLAWIVAGSVKYFKRGDLEYPPCVLAATAELLCTNDALGEFFKECVTVNINEKIGVTEMKSVYYMWSLKEAYEPLKAHTFNRMMGDRNFRRKDAVINGRVLKCWLGLTLSKAGRHLIASDEEQAFAVKEKLTAKKASVFSETEN